MHPEDSISTADQNGAKTIDGGTPWSSTREHEDGACVYVCDANREEMATVYAFRYGSIDDDQALANARATARRIVTAVNAHEELVEALRDLSYASKHARANHYKSEFGLRAAEDKADGLLAKLKS